MPDAIADAACILIAEASPETVRAVLRLLIDNLPPAGVAPAASPPAARASPPRAPSGGIPSTGADGTLAASARKPSARPRQAGPADPEWEALRRQMREAMRERGLDFAGVGATIGRSATAVRIDLTSRRPPRAAIQGKLRGWLEAPAVASATPFRGNGAAAVA